MSNQLLHDHSADGIDVPHLIASGDGRFRASGALDTGGQYVLTLDTPGTYPYLCTLHPRMTGRIVVT